MRVRTLLLLLPLAASCVRAPSSLRVEPVPGKRAEGRTGMVSASHADAAAAGAAILRQGGNAVDAAVATAFALSVVDPSQTGLGGGGSATLWLRASRRAESVDFMAASGADSMWSVTGSGGASGARNGRAAAVPGTVAGLLHLLERHGSLPRATVLAPAIRLAREGFVVSPLLSRTIGSSVEKLRADSGALARFAPGGTALQPGDRLVQPELAATLDRIAREGTPGFYGGEIAANLASKVRATGGLITEADMRDYRVLTPRPLCARFAGYTVLSAPPTLSGMSVAQSLAIIERALPADSLGTTLAESPRAALVLADALRIADADRVRWRGDPAVLAVPARGVASAAYATERAVLIGNTGERPEAGDPWEEESAAVPRGMRVARSLPCRDAPRIERCPGEDASGDAAWGSNTSHLSVVDGQRNAVSMTFTVGVLFGSGVYTDGFFLNSAGSNFDRRTAGPNRRNNSTMAPTILLDGSAVRLVVGAAGSQYIPPAIVQTVVHVARYGRDVGDALAAPRLSPGQGRSLEIEPGWSPAVYAALRAAGFSLRNRIADMQFGGVHAIQVRKDGVLVGAADPRRDGVAVGY